MRRRDGARGSHYLFRFSQWRTVRRSRIPSRAFVSLVPAAWLFHTVDAGYPLRHPRGMVASDVHGKNHHRDGKFGQHVLGLSLRVADGRLITCSETENAELFRATHRWNGADRPHPRRDCSIDQGALALDSAGNRACQRRRAFHRTAQNSGASVADDRRMDRRSLEGQSAAYYRWTLAGRSGQSSPPAASSTRSTGSETGIVFTAAAVSFNTNVSSRRTMLKPAPSVSCRSSTRQEAPRFSV
jgi:hypothetical protein